MENTSGKHCSASTGKSRTQATVEKPMTHCSKCRRQVPLYGDEKCPCCGAAVHEPTGPTCPHCGTQMQDAAGVCVVCGAEIPGRFDKKPVIRVFRWMVYKKADGLYGISIIGWVVLTVLVVAVMGIIALITMLTA